ncbi:SRPBCC domain-containing protein [Streptomyces sp. NPDC047725]|uniref:SRPBCC domain-containing protein n=1 Tax=Streptomyces sp. NPDC047725 TaxID=3365487 RepID=UPI0037151224
MEHEVFVPVPAERLRDVLADPHRVARAVPGLQQDAGAEPVAGRLKVRVGGHSITYRGSLRLSARDDGTYAVDGDAAESRGAGTVTLALTLRLRDGEEGSTLVFGGTATADGRVTELPSEAVASATARLLTRFAENLGAAAAEDGPAERPPSSPTAAAPAAHTSVFDTEIPPSSLDPSADEDEGPEGSEGGEGGEGDGESTEGGEGEAAGAAEPPATPEGAEPPAEAAHARRTMIGRSAEEVDHAPPRGRYAPVPAPQAGGAGTSLRWAAPAAALAVASAIVVGRALRRRH